MIFNMMIQLVQRFKAIHISKVLKFSSALFLLKLGLTIVFGVYTLLRVKTEDELLLLPAGSGLSHSLSAVSDILSSAYWAGLFYIAALVFQFWGTGVFLPLRFITRLVNYTSCAMVLYSLLKLYLFLESFTLTPVKAFSFMDMIQVLITSYVGLAVHFVRLLFPALTAIVLCFAFDRTKGDFCR